jgi:hypothetical protein
LELLHLLKLFPLLIYICLFYYLLWHTVAILKPCQTPTIRQRCANPQNGNARFIATTVPRTHLWPNRSRPFPALQYFVSAKGGPLRLRERRALRRADARPVFFSAVSNKLSLN